MARADIETLLPPDQWASLMAIHPDHFNQCEDPNNTAPTECRVWRQHGWFDQNTGRIAGREDVAQAIATAELKMEEKLLFALAPKYYEDEIHNWPRPVRGVQVCYPPIQTNKGYLIKGGQRAMTIIDEDAPIVYSASVVGGVLDTATISITAAQMATASASRAEVQVFWPDEIDDIWRIKYLDVEEDAVTGDITITGRRSQFVTPEAWLTNEVLSLAEAANFETVVDVYRVYTDDQEAQLQWKDGNCFLCGCLAGSCDSVATCDQTCQESCLIIHNERLGEIQVKPATVSGGTWTASTFNVSRLPDRVRLWYQAGWALQVNSKRYRIRPDIAEAIVRLSNVYLVASPCNCQQTQSRWRRDTESMAINSIDAGMAMSAFGEVTRGTIWAWNTVKSLKPLGQGGSLVSGNW